MRLRPAIASLALAAITATASLGCAPAEPLDVAPSVDLQRFQGKWFEIARLPRITQTNCTGTTASYTLREGGIDVVNQCNVGKLDGPVQSSAQRLDTTSEGPAKLSIEVAGFLGDYWIIDLGESYEYAVVGVPSRDYLWILSRTPKLNQPTLDGIVERARTKKFPVEKLQYTVQSDGTAIGGAIDTPPVGLTPATYGCAWAGAPRSGGESLPATLGVLAALAVWHRARRKA